jgi:hypothetical protein
MQHALELRKIDFGLKTSDLEINCSAAQGLMEIKTLKFDIKKYEVVITQKVK